MTIRLNPSNLGQTRSDLGLGTAAVADTGTGNGDIPVLDGTGYPAINGSQITTLTSANLTGALPAVSGAALTSIPAGNLTGSIADARLPAALQSFPAPGSSGNQLQSNGSVWQSVAAGGSGGVWELINFTEAANSTSLTGINYNNLTSHNVFKFIAQSSEAPFSAPGLKLHVGTSSSPNVTNNYESTEKGGRAGITAGNISSLTDQTFKVISTGFRMGFGAGPQSAEAVIFNLRESFETMFIANSVTYDKGSGNNVYVVNISAVKDDTSPYNSLHLRPSHGSFFVKGKFFLLGLKES